jgi:class 3 adenylate cyclase
VRIGISAGDVTARAGDYYGVPVIEAARLCAAATGGQILASEIVRSLVGSGPRRPCAQSPSVDDESRSRHTVDPQGPPFLKRGTAL